MSSHIKYESRPLDCWSKAKELAAKSLRNAGEGRTAL
jgi:hypothetical protein